MKIWQFFRWGVVYIIVFYTCFVLYYNFNNDTVNNEHSSFHVNKIGGDFTLTDQYGVERSISDFRGKYILVYFGYTLCNNICHQILKNISEALEILEENSEKIVPIFVTVNPERDTVSNLKNYSKNFHAKFVMMTGSIEQINPILNKYKVYYSKVKSDETIDFFIEHSNLAYLLDRNGILVQLFDQSISPKDLANKLKVFLDF